MNALGRALTEHRKQCGTQGGTCTRHRACHRYLAIVRAHTEPRRIHIGATAPHQRLDIREAT